VISELFSWLATRTATQKRFSNHLINKWTTGKPTAKVLLEHGHWTAVCVLRYYQAGRCDRINKAGEENMTLTMPYSIRKISTCLHIL